MDDPHLNEENMESVELHGTPKSSVALNHTETQTREATTESIRTSHFSPVNELSQPPSSSPRPSDESSKLFNAQTTETQSTPRAEGNRENTKLQEGVATSPMIERATLISTSTSKGLAKSVAILPSNVATLREGMEHIEKATLPSQQANIDGSFIEYERRNNRSLVVPSDSKSDHRKSGPIDISKVEATQRAWLERKRLAAKRVKLAQPPIMPNNAAHDIHDDDSWMGEATNFDREYDDLLDKVAMLQKRKDNGKISSNENITLGRLKKELLLQAKFRAATARANNGEDEKDNLFVPEESIREAGQRHLRSAPDVFQNEYSEGDIKDEDIDDINDMSQIDEMNETIDANSKLTPVERMDLDDRESATSDSGSEGSEEMHTSEKPQKIAKIRRKPAKNAREFHERERQELQNKERKKAQKKKTRDPPKVPRKESNKSKRNKAAKKPKGSVKITKDLENMLNNMGIDPKTGEDGIAEMFLKELTAGDQIADRILNPIFNTAPEKIIFTRRKDTQLQKLLEDIPEGTDAKSARSDRAKLNKAAKSFGSGRVRAIDRKWLVNGMKSPLLHHQLIGAQWMLSREFGTGPPPYGGLLADAMGLGKTVQTLACMVGNPAQEEDRKRGRGATLIVAPSSIIQQWVSEAHIHAKESVFPKIYHYTAKSKLPQPILESLDIVVTSYTEVMRQFPWPRSKEEVKEMKKVGFEAWFRDIRGQAGVLHQISWYRVVLDEAHAIKNHWSRTSRACQNLTSLYKWCLTGTPLMNSLEEMYPYLRFIGADYEMDWNVFQKKLCDPTKEESYERLAVVLSNSMMRRTMKTPIMNRPIITLPMPHPEIQYASFSPQEMLIYKITEDCLRTAINMLLKDGSAAFKYTHIFVYLLRLRKCVSHPYMLEETIKEHWSEEDVKRLKDGLLKLSGDHTPFYEQCEAWVKQSAAERRAIIDAGGRGDNASQIPPSMPFGASDFGYDFKMEHILAGKQAYQIMCGICGNLPEGPTKINCGHIFCKECLDSSMHNAAAADDFDFFVCPRCGQVVADITPCNNDQHNAGNAADSLDFEDMSSGSRFPGGSKSKRRTVSGPGTDEMGFEPSSAPSTWLSMSDDDPNAKLVPSTKVAVLKSLLLKGFEEAPMDKVIIYVQFRLVARIIGRMCKKEGWKFVYLTGDTSLDHRTSAINMFKDKADVKILIAGLRCGGLGLNLAFANRCISLDLWWNHAVEQQAFGRIFRLGQKKETHMTRIAVRDTLDMRFLSVQLRKMRCCDNAMEERAKLELPELVKLFGFLKTDADGNITEVVGDFADEDVSETPRNVDEVPNGMQWHTSSSDGTYSGGDWSFGATLEVHTGSEPGTVKSGSSASKASPSSRSQSGDSSGSIKHPASPSASTSLPSSNAAFNPSDAVPSIWGSIKGPGSHSGSHPATISNYASIPNSTSESLYDSNTELRTQVASTSKPDVGSGSISNPVKTEDCSEGFSFTPHSKIGGYLYSLRGSGSEANPMVID